MKTNEIYIRSEYLKFDGKYKNIFRVIDREYREYMTGIRRTYLHNIMDVNICFYTNDKLLGKHEMFVSFNTICISFSGRGSYFSVIC